jgi:geranylgeranyl pyrophosphate synthase
LLRKIFFEKALKREMEELTSTLPRPVLKNSRYFTMGKMLRSTLMRDIALALQVDLDLVIVPAAILELIHTTTILHDDVIDLTLDRRGQKTLNARFKSSVAVFSADLLFSRSMGKLAELKFQSSIENHPTANFGAIEKAVHDFLLQVCLGEMNQDFRPGVESTPSASECQEIARAKTGALFALSAVIPSHLCRMSEGHRDWLQESGSLIGTIFQLLDDLPDLEFDSREIVEGQAQFKHWTYANAIWSKLDATSWKQFISLEKATLPSQTKKAIEKQVVLDCQNLWKAHREKCPEGFNSVAVVFDQLLVQIIAQTRALLI